MTKARTLIFAGGVLAAATQLCRLSSDGDVSAFDHTPYRPFELAGRMLYRSNALGLPGPMALLGDTLLVLDMLAEPALHVVDRWSGQLLSMRGRQGEGPGEFVAPVALDLSGNGETAWIHDVRLQRLSGLSLSAASDDVAFPTHPLRADGPVIDVVWTSPGSFLGHGFFHGGRLAMFDAPQGHVRYSGALPDDPSGAPANVLQQAYQGSLAARPDRQLFALATRHASWIEIFDARGRRVRRFSGPFRFDPVFDVDRRGAQPVLATSSQLRFGYIDVATTQHRLYALFSGRTRSGFPERANYAEYVHVFDWEGELECMLHLSQDAFSIVVDASESVLYAVQHDPAPAVIEYAGIARAVRNGQTGGWP